MEFKQFIINALEEDIADGDHSTLACISENEMGKAILKVKENGILAGVAIAEDIFKIVEPSTSFKRYINDGAKVAPGDIAYEVEAKVHTILKVERLMLNIMQRMSGIASLTHQYVEKIINYPAKILDTRKTTPNFRWFEKQAVLIGGGYNHRMGLYDMIMLKDNHIDYCGGIEKAIDKTNQYLREHHLSLKIEVEARTLEDVEKVMKHGGVDRIMLDNFSPENLTKAIQLIDKKFETEASGGITLDTIEQYAATMVDYISVGAIIHHAQSMDLSLKAVK
ncbi:MAG: carboxylating nicotinate-nucleotide diphosphorylase [Chitinophagaceae bacterium]|nr:MAG: nicotinate-nucleotide pyrophosphorylase [Bacteroidetes bacterium OLB11]MCC6447850.1 carboxylating nicotinate-nucleotide diphosphorylase [Chitinophagaceae bacterium]HMN32503.1 carboxylating nicotinate-nucleotide diphosphorylase [Chitinophagaceae bacterium]